MWSPASKDLVTVFFPNASEKNPVFKFWSGQVGGVVFLCKVLPCKYEEDIQLSLRQTVCFHPGAPPERCSWNKFLTHGPTGLSWDGIPNGMVLHYWDCKVKVLRGIVPVNHLIFVFLCHLPLGLPQMRCLLRHGRRVGGEGGRESRKSFQKLSMCPNLTPLSGLDPNIIEIWPKVYVYGCFS